MKIIIPEHVIYESKNQTFSESHPLCGSFESNRKVKVTREQVDYYDRGDSKWYQTERWYFNGRPENMSNYPVDSYAENRLNWIKEHFPE